jgi:PiT family inorganic phosphate transporter
METLLVLAALFVAFNNGANDNFKGFATVWGSGTLSYRQALMLATAATVAGSLASWLLADGLVAQFSGKGLVPTALASTPAFILSVASGTALTVFLATRFGLPVSTTHALIGGLLGAGIAESPGEVRFTLLAQAFLLPLLIGPLIAATLGGIAYRLLRRRRAEEDCACLIASTPSLSQQGMVIGLHRVGLPSLVIAEHGACDRGGPALRWSLSRFLDRLHVASAMSICFARGVNDTPKLAALLLAAQMVGRPASVALIGIVMAAGGLVYAARVAQTMSHRLNRMDATQGLAANLITATLVLFASKLGMPVSTTHVSVGSIAGVGAGARTLDWPALRGVLLSWAATLPLAAAAAWLVLKLV